MRRLLCCAWAMLSVTVMVPGAEAQDHTPVVAASAAPVANASRIAVFGAYRPVDPTRVAAGGTPKSMSPVAQRGLDLYLNVGASSASINTGQVFSVFRAVAAPNTLDAPALVLKVGEVEIMSLQGPLAIGKVVAGPDAATQPYLRTPGILVGDFIDPARPVMKGSVSSGGEGGGAGKKSRRRAKHAGAPKGMMATATTTTAAAAGATEPCPQPEGSTQASKDETPNNSSFKPPTLEFGTRAVDPDDFRSWDSRPIDF